MHIFTGFKKISRLSLGLFYGVGVLCVSLDTLGAPPPQEVCSKVVVELTGKLAPPRSLSEKDYRKLGFKTEQNGNFHQALTLVSDKSQWNNDLKGMKNDFSGLSKSVRNLHAPSGVVGLPPPQMLFSETPEGVSLAGHRYIVSRSGNERRIFRMNVRESITRSRSGEVTHYVSVNVEQLLGNGEVKKVTYVDSPHIAAGKALWFHAHQADTGAVIGEIGAQGFTHSSLPDIFRWVNKYVDGLPR